MLAIVLIAVFGVTWFLIARRAQFIDQFARLLHRSVVHRTPAGALAGRAHATGTYGGRDVAVRMQLRRSRHEQAHLVVAMQVNGPPSLTAADLDAHVDDDTGRQALARLAGHDLLLTVEDGWLKAVWHPPGFTIFPANFVGDTWRTVLDSLMVAAIALEAAAAGRSRGTRA